MAENSGIHWTDATLNAATGCTEVSDGCTYCYARLLALRLQAMGQKRYANGFEYTEHPEVINKPLTWKQPKRIFVNSMSDCFHEKATKPFVFALFDMMLTADWHTFQVLTKRPQKAASWLRQFCRERGLTTLPTHIWVGTSVENQAAADLRIPALLRVPAAVRFLSCEPLLGPLDLMHWLCLVDADDLARYMAGPATPDTAANLQYGLHWVIVGGESGPNHRPLDLDWARSIRDQCQQTGVPFFFKQGNGPRPGMHRELDGRLWEEFPTVATPTAGQQRLGGL